MNRETTTPTQRRLRLEALRVELHELYRLEQRQTQRINELAREIADIQNVDNKAGRP